jgi:hypothetical protein
MSRKILLVCILALGGVVFFQGLAMAGACKQLGLGSKNCITSADIKTQAVKRSDINNNIDGLTGNGMLKAWARINADGTVASCWRCNTVPTETQSLPGTGTYEVDFTPVGTDISGRPRMAVLDNLGTGSTSGSISLADRAGDPSSVYVVTLDTTGGAADRPFVLIIF